MSTVEKKVQLQDVLGNQLFPRTKADLVVTADGGNLANAQENKIEKIKLNGVELSIVDKAVDVVLPAAAVYTVEKAASAEDGFAATYKLMKDGVQAGASINIPKDMVVQSGSVKTVETADQPVAGYTVGQKYIDIVLANADDQHIYILVNDLVDIYTAGDGVKIDGRSISVDDTVFARKSWVQEELDKKAVKTEVEAALALKADQTAVNEALALKADQTALTEGLAGKADKATTLAGYGITDAYTKAEADAAFAPLEGSITYVELA